MSLLFRHLWSIPYYTMDDVRIDILEPRPLVGTVCAKVLSDEGSVGWSYRHSHLDSISFHKRRFDYLICATVRYDLAIVQQ